MSLVGDVAAQSSWMRRRQGSDERRLEAGGKARAQRVELGDRGASSIALPADHVDRAEGRDDVGELVALEQRCTPPMCTKLGERTCTLYGRASPSLTR